MKAQARGGRVHSSEDRTPRLRSLLLISGQTRQALYERVGDEEVHSDGLRSSDASTSMRMSSGCTHTTLPSSQVAMGLPRALRKRLESRVASINASSIARPAANRSS